MRYSLQKEMAIMFMYLLPVLFAIVFIPKSIDSATVIKTDELKTTITEMTGIGIDEAAQDGSPENINQNHKHRHGKMESDMKSGVTDEVSRIADKINSDQEITSDDDQSTDDTRDEIDEDMLEDSQEDSVKELTDDIDPVGIGNEEIYSDDENIDGGDDDEDGELDDSADETVSNENDNISENRKMQTDTTESELPDPDNACPKCTDETLSEKDIKIEMVKQTLLQKLGLSSAPEVDGPLPPLPFDFYVGEDFSMNDEEDNEEEERRQTVKTREIFVYGKDITKKCAKKRGTGCYSFNTTSPNIDPDLVSSIELWIYKQPDVNDHHIQEFMVSELQPYIKGGKEVLRFKNIVKRIDTRLKYGWMKIYVRRSVIRWLSKPHRNHGLAVVCKTCQRENHKTIYGNKEGYMPILVFYMKQNARSHKRVRRHTNCREGGSNCCHKEELEINFRDIGWDYIMTPESIRPNFCTGSCNGVRAAYYNHTRLVQTLQQSVTNNYAQVQTCCSPVSFGRPQSLLYRDHEGNVRKVDVPDLIVGECGCT